MENLNEVIGQIFGEDPVDEREIYDLTVDDDEVVGGSNERDVAFDVNSSENDDDDNVDGFNEDLVVNVGGTINPLPQDGDGDEGPKTGMMYASLATLFAAYQAYAKCKGFSVVKRTNKKYYDEREIRYARFTCCKAGKRSVRMLSKKTECQARLNAIMQRDGSWIVGRVYHEHNHDLDPNYSSLMPAHRQLTVNQEIQLQSIDIAGIRPSKNIRLLEVQAGGPENLGCLRKDCRNFIEKSRRRRLGAGDAEAVYNLFNRLNLKDPNFYHLMDIDDEGRLRNVLWIHPRSRAAYEDFHDAVSFDTTYLVNRHKMPFAAFIGVNHHGQSILLGCALVTSEDIASFKWIFSNWLAAMGGITPVGIITDQDESIKVALVETMPYTIHRYCIWHILSKLPIKFKGAADYHKCVTEFKAIVYDSLDIMTFESKWAQFRVEHGFESNRWLDDLYSEREKWVPIYLNHTFWAGMISTQRSEGMHAYFDEFLHSRMTLIQFMEQYEMAIGSKIQKEFHADFDSNNRLRMCLIVYKWEKQFQDAYTNAMFARVQDAIERMKYCFVSVDDDSPQAGVEKFKVLEMKIFNDYFRKDYTYTVVYKRNGEYVECNCKNFEFKGILCCHIFETLRTIHVSTVHERYILRRWRKDVHRSCSSIFFCGGYPHMTEEYKEHQELEKFFKLTSDVAFGNKEMMAHMKKKYQETMEDILNWNNTSRQKARSAQVGQKRSSRVGGSKSASQSLVEPTPSTQLSQFSQNQMGTQESSLRIPIRNPQITKTKGRPTERRIKSCLERGGRRGRGRATTVRGGRGGRNTNQ